MKKAILYVGHNNETKELEVEKIIEITGNYFEGFTTEQVIGYWKGARENTLKIEIVTDSSDATITKLCRDLRKQLNQDAIMLEIVESNIAFISN